MVPQPGLPIGFSLLSRGPLGLGPRPELLLYTLGRPFDSQLVETACKR
jgi:hypothetical protein